MPVEALLKEIETLPHVYEAWLIAYLEKSPQGTQDPCCLLTRSILEYLRLSSDQDKAATKQALIAEKAFQEPAELLRQQMTSCVYQVDLGVLEIFQKLRDFRSPINKDDVQMFRQVAEEIAFIEQECQRVEERLIDECATKEINIFRGNRQVISKLAMDIKKGIHQYEQAEENKVPVRRRLTKLFSRQNLNETLRQKSTNQISEERVSSLPEEVQTLLSQYADAMKQDGNKADKFAAREAELFVLHIFIPIRHFFRNMQTNNTEDLIQQFYRGEPGYTKATILLKSHFRLRKDSPELNIALHLKKYYSQYKDHPIMKAIFSEDSEVARFLDGFVKREEMQEVNYSERERLLNDFLMKHPAPEIRIGLFYHLNKRALECQKQLTDYPETVFIPKRDAFLIQRLKAIDFSIVYEALALADNFSRMDITDQRSMAQGVFQKAQSLIEQFNIDALMIEIAEAQKEGGCDFETNFHLELFALRRLQQSREYTFPPSLNAVYFPSNLGITMTAVKSVSEFLPNAAPVRISEASIKTTRTVINTLNMLIQRFEKVIIPYFSDQEGTPPDEDTFRELVHAWISEMQPVLQKIDPEGGGKLVSLEGKSRDELFDVWVSRLRDVVTVMKSLNIKWCQALQRKKGILLKPEHFSSEVLQKHFRENPKALFQLMIHSVTPAIINQKVNKAESSEQAIAFLVGCDVNLPEEVTLLIADEEKKTDRDRLYDQLENSVVKTLVLNEENQLKDDISMETITKINDGVYNNSSQDFFDSLTSIFEAPEKVEDLDKVKIEKENQALKKEWIDEKVFNTKSIDLNKEISAIEQAYKTLVKKRPMTSDINFRTLSSYFNHVENCQQLMRNIISQQGNLGILKVLAGEHGKEKALLEAQEKRLNFLHVELKKQLDITPDKEKIKIFCNNLKKNINKINDLSTISTAVRILSRLAKETALLDKTTSKAIHNALKNLQKKESALTQVKTNWLSAMKVVKKRDLSDEYKAVKILLKSIKKQGKKIRDQKASRKNKKNRMHLDNIRLFLEVSPQISRWLSGAQEAYKRLDLFQARVREEDADFRKKHPKYTEQVENFSEVVRAVQGKQKVLADQYDYSCDLFLIELKRFQNDQQKERALRLLRDILRYEQSQKSQDADRIKKINEAISKLQPKQNIRPAKSPVSQIPGVEFSSLSPKKPAPTQDESDNLRVSSEQEQPLPSTPTDTKPVREQPEASREPFDFAAHLARMQQDYPMNALQWQCEATERDFVLKEPVKSNKMGVIFSYTLDVLRAMPKRHIEMTPGQDVDGFRKMFTIAHEAGYDITILSNNTGLTKDNILNDPALHMLREQCRQSSELQELKTASLQGPQSGFKR